MKTFYLFSALLFLSATINQASAQEIPTDQNILKLEKARPVYFTPGSTVKLELKTSKKKVKGEITFITHNLIVVNKKDTVYLDSIRAMYVPRTEFDILARKQKLIVAGVGFIAIVQLNDLIIDRKMPTLDFVYPVSASLIAVGIAFDFLRVRKVIINYKHTLFVMGP